MDEEYFFNERPEQINANPASMLLMKKVEFSFWQGKRNKITDSTTGKMLYTTGGIIDFVPKDTSHQINFGGVLTPVGINNAMKDIIKLGGSTERWLFGGYSFITALNNAFDNKIRLHDGFVSRYGLRIQTIEQSIGGTLHIVPSFALTEMGYDWEAFVLDLGRIFNLLFLKGNILVHE